MAGGIYYPPGYLIADSKSAVRQQCRKACFLALPGEIRNHVYEILFDELRVLVQGNRPQKELQRAVEQKRTVKPRYRLYGAFARMPPSKFTAVEQPWISVELLQVCRTIYREATPLFYAAITLQVNASMTVLDRFLNIASPHGVTSLKRLELYHATYGEPELLDMREWKIRHDNNWLKLCQRVAKEMIALESVYISLRINDWPTQLDASARWAKPLLALKGPGLDRVDIVLKHRSFSDQRLAAASRKLEMEMMNREGRERRKAEEEFKMLEAARIKKEEPARALKSLRITLPASSPTRPCVKPSSKPVVPTSYSMPQ